MNTPLQPCVDKYGFFVCESNEGQSGNTRVQSSQDVEQILNELYSSYSGNIGASFSLKRNSNVEQKSQNEKRKDRPNFETYHQLIPKLRPNTASLTEEERVNAQMIRAGKTAYKKGFVAAQAEVDAGSLRGWKIDTELSSSEGLVLTKGEEIRVAYRGTDFANFNDLVTDAAIVAGREQLAPQMVDSEVQIEAIRAKYGRLPSELLGYSKGGGHAMAMGDKFEIPTTNYNPLIGRKQLFSKSEVPHKIVRTMEDPVSTPLVLARGKKNYTVKSINPIRGLGDPKSAHDLNQFTTSGPRQPGGIQQLMTEGVLRGQQLGYYETLDAMKTGVEQGKTFTETLDEFNTSNGAVQRVDVLDDGSLGPRIHKESGTVQFWQKSGGTFTPEEQAHLNSNPSPPPRQYSDEAKTLGLDKQLTEAQQNYVLAMSAAERVKFMQDQRSLMQEHIQLTNDAIEPHRTVISGMMPKTSSLAVGAVAGMAANATMNVVDPDHKMNRVASEATEGAIAGGIGATTATAMGATVALGPEVLAGSAAYLAGSESGLAIASAMEQGGSSQDTAEAVGSVAGGAIGGVTASSVATGAALATSVAAGAEVGEAVGMVGGPIGMAVGAAAGVTIGAAVGGIGYLISHW